MEACSLDLIFFFCKKDPHFFVFGLCIVHGRGALAEDVLL